MKKLIIANWKMNPKNVSEAVLLFDEIKYAAAGLKNTTTVVCPPAVFLSDLQKPPLQKKPKKTVRKSESEQTEEVTLGAQDVFWEFEGAYTGELSPFQLSSVDVKYIIVGHSERRALGDSDEIVAKKITVTLKSGFFGILCVGERGRDTEGAYFHFIESQIKTALAGNEKRNLKRLIIAYEPIWAISTTENARPATPADFLEMSIFIRKVLADMFGSTLAKNIPILYGGSTNETNAYGFLSEGQANGLLVGGASLSGKKFGEILKIADGI